MDELQNHRFAFTQSRLFRRGKLRHRGEVWDLVAGKFESGLLELVYQNFNAKVSST